MFNRNDFAARIDHLKRLITESIVRQDKYNRVISVLLKTSFVPVIISGCYFIYWVIMNLFFKKFEANDYYLFAPLPLLIMILIYDHSEEALEILVKRRTRIERAMSDLENINSILRNRKEFIFYLRDFAGSRAEVRNFRTVSASPSGAPSPFASKMDYGKLSTQLCIQYFKSKYPLLFLDSEEDKTLFTGGYIIYPNDAQWFDVFQELLLHAKFVIIDYDFSSLTENIKREIDALIKGDRKKILFVGTKKDTDLLKKNYPSLHRLVYHCLEVKIEQHFDKETTIDFSTFEGIR